jgi:hypothetical protein
MSSAPSKETIQMKSELKHSSFFERVLDERRDIVRQVAGYKVIDIRPAAVQFHASHPDDTRYKVAQVASNVAPPFLGFVMTADCPSGLEVHGYGRSAVIFTALPFEDASYAAQSCFRERPRWTLNIAVLLELNGRIGPLRTMLRMYVYGDGSLASSREDQWMFDLDTSELNTIRSSDGASFMLDWFVAPCFFALTLMHCKGVTLKQMTPPQHHSRKVRKRRQSLPKFEHHVIEIRDRHGRVVNHDELKSAMARGLHIVRGHFSTYTEDAPLFGRIVGTFWIPAHVRGTASEGVISSEYSVSAA